MGYMDILNFAVLVPKGQGCLQSLTSNISAVTKTFWLKLIYLYSL